MSLLPDVVSGLSVCILVHAPCGPAGAGLGCGQRLVVRLGRVKLLEGRVCKRPTHVSGLHGDCLFVASLQPPTLPQACGPLTRYQKCTIMKPHIQLFDFARYCKQRCVAKTPSSDAGLMHATTIFIV